MAASGAITLKVYILPFAFPCLAVLAVLAYSNGFGSWNTPDWVAVRPWLFVLAPLLYHVAVPVLDLMIGKHEHLEAEEEKDAGPSKFSSRDVPALAIALHFAVAIFAYFTVTTVPHPAQGGFWWLVYNVALSGNVALAASHECVHSRHAFHILMSEAFLCYIGMYPYFRQHHMHHAFVGTPKDFTCAPKGQGWPRYAAGYVINSYREALALDINECRRAGRPVWSTHNRTLMGVVAEVGMLAAVLALFGGAAAVMHVTVAATCVAFLTIIDYALHYGLRRPPLAQQHQYQQHQQQSKPPHQAESQAEAEGAQQEVDAAQQKRPLQGRFAPITAYTSWNSGYVLENALTFNVLRHSEHHLAGMKGYRSLECRPEYPIFPMPVTVLLPLVAMPAVWRAVMDVPADKANVANDQYLARRSITTKNMS